ncbi:MAG: 50S ribosomal protein L11 methyltransferase [Polyangiaceae bacterium]|jgi:precorrin-6B methylase 2
MDPTENGAKPPDTSFAAGPLATGELSIREHILMVNDLPRGQKYSDAMKAKIRRGDLVLEVGTGAGLLSCIAARLGAKHVYSVEQSPLLYRVARKVVETNGLSDKITLLNVHSKDLVGLGVIQEPIDVFVTETIGTQGIDEGILLILDHVKPLLSPKAKIIPENIVFKHCLVNMSGIREQVEVLGPILGFDLSALNAEVGTNQLFWMQPIEPWREVSTTVRTPTYDLMDFKPRDSTQVSEVIRENVCDGMLNWAEFKLAKGISIETRYRSFGGNWANSIHFMQRMLVSRGQVCTATFRIRDDKLSWDLNWTVATRDEPQAKPERSNGRP